MGRILSFYRWSAGAAASRYGTQACMSRKREPRPSPIDGLAPANHLAVLTDKWAPTRQDPLVICFTSGISSVSLTVGYVYNVFFFIQLFTGNIGGNTTRQFWYCSNNDLDTLMHASEFGHKVPSFVFPLSFPGKEYDLAKKVGQCHLFLRVSTFYLFV